MTKLAAPDSSYDRDFYAWANEQAALLRAGELAHADLEHIAEELESMGKGEKRELVSRLTVLLLHLLKWRFQPELRSTSWRLTVEEQRLQVDSHLADNPSLKALLGTAVADSYRLAVIGARRETGLSAATFPTHCPWSFDQLMDDEFWPE
jgi:Domain of unknown function DUF29